MYLKKGWLCPHCPQFSARHWNLKIHIQRRHGGVGQPCISGPHLPSQQFFPNMSNSSYYGSHYQTHNKETDISYRQKDPGSSRNNFYHEESLDHTATEKESLSHSNSIRDILDETHETLRKMLEIKNMSNQLQSTSPGQTAFMGGWRAPFTDIM